MLQIYKDQIIAGTKEDSQGERLPKEFFEDMVANLPSRMPLGQRHDFRMESPGYMENIRLVQDPVDDEEWVVVADIYVLPEKLVDVVNGFSFSSLQDIGSNSATPTHRIYLPYPHYKNEIFVKELIDADDDLLVGRWIKKSADPLAIGLIATGIAFLLAPEWDIQYRQHIRPLMIKLLAHLPALTAKGVTPDLLHHVIGKTGENVKVYLVPDRENVGASYEENHMIAALECVRQFLDGDRKTKTIGVAMIKLYFERDIFAYKIFHVQYIDGSDVHIA